MSNIISDSVSKLSAITDQTPIDWDAFDSVLKGLEDINAYDEHDEETILSEFIMDGEFYKRGFILADVVRHFLACGYDVSANDGLNGGLALHSLCWSSYDHYVLEAAKVLMNAGAPVKYRTSGDDSNEEPECLLGSIGWKISGAWMVDKDYAWANILEAYYAMTEANIAGKDYNTIDNYFACIGKPLTAVSAINVGGKPALYDEGAVSVYSEPLILWFENKPLVVSCYTDFVVNPVYADGKKDDLADVTTAFSSLTGTTLKEVQYIGATICYFEFSNGKRLFFAGRDIGDGKRVGTFDILADSKKVNVEQLCILYKFVVFFQMIIQIISFFLFIVKVLDNIAQSPAFVAVANHTAIYGRHQVLDICARLSTILRENDLGYYFIVIVIPKRQRFSAFPIQSNFYRSIHRFISSFGFASVCRL